MKFISQPLKQSEIDQIVLTKLNWILEYTQPLKVILFGSAATGEMTDASDVDIIIVYPNEIDLKSISYILAQSRPINDWPHDLILQTEKSFLSSVAKGGGACWLANKEGKILFEKEKKL